MLDWNSYAGAHPEWFQTDFIHLRPAGGLAIATWIHQAIDDTLAPPAPPPSTGTPLVVPVQAMVGRVGVHFDRHLHAGGGTAPFRWRTTGVSLRKAGLHLLANGDLTGRPGHARTFTLPLQVTDAGGSTAKVTVAFTVKRSTRVRTHAGG